MSSVNPRNITLSQTSVLGSKKSEVVCTSVQTRFKRDPETRQATDEIEGYAAVVLSARGESQTVKLPDTVKDEIVRISEAIQQDKVVKVVFTNFRGKFWAMNNPNTGKLNQGISVNASDVKVISVEDPSEDDFEEIDL